VARLFVSFANWDALNGELGSTDLPRWLAPAAIAMADDLPWRLIDTGLPPTDGHKAGQGREIRGRWSQMETIVWERRSRRRETVDAMCGDRDRESSGGMNGIDHGLGLVVLIHGWGRSGSIREESSRTHDGSARRKLGCQPCRAGLRSGRRTAPHGEGRPADPC
jgi:hypothetical protein